ncbi:universal stress protein [Streptomyces sp. GSL17-111]|uniref:universal stress protein n=1 Tax=Streptomyces sp. GSL17-111 TaxID=3121596 RepID=UPI0030F4AD12
MPQHVVVGLDGSLESRVAARWAAREAVSREAPLLLVQVQDVDPDPLARVPGEAAAHEWAEHTAEDVQAELHRTHATLRSTTEVREGAPPDVLAELSSPTGLLVLGSRGLGAIRGFLVGSVALPTVARAHGPVVLVRPRPEPSPPETATTAPRARVVVGVDLDAPAGEVLAFAFDTAARWGAALHAVHGWEPPPAFGVRPLVAAEDARVQLNQEKEEALVGLLRPWAEEHPAVPVEARAVVGVPGRLLLDAAADAGLLVVGRHVRRGRLGPHIGSLAHAALHHAEIPVAVVPHP